MKSWIILAFTLVGFYFTACTKKKNSNPTTTAHTVYREDKLLFAMVGYDTTELGTVVLKRFSPDNTFSNFVDSVVYVTMPGTGAWVIYNGSSTKDSLLNARYLIVDCVDTAYRQYDYEVIVPSVQRIYKITGVAFSGNITSIVEDCCPVMYSCRGVICNIDGQPYVDSSFNFQRYLFLSK